MLLRNIRLWLSYLGTSFSVFKPRYCWVPQNKYSTFPPLLIALLYSIVVCVIDIFCWSSLDFLSCVNLFTGMFHDLLYFNHRAVLRFWTGGRHLFGRFTTSNYTLDGLLENPSTALSPTGVSSLRIIGEESLLLINSVSVQPSLNGVVLIGKLVTLIYPLLRHYYLMFHWF